MTKHYYSPGPVLGARDYKNGLCLKELLAQVERKIVHSREDDRMRHRM